jgi:nucleotide-binding universal stress UspA family protein
MNIIIIDNNRHSAWYKLYLVLPKKGMKKILVVFDGAHFPTTTLDFALRLNEESPILLTGVFLPSVDYAEAMSHYHYGPAVAPLYMDEYEDDVVAIEENIELFETFCDDNHIRYTVHKDINKKVAKELKSETRYADLLILSSTHFYKNLGEKIQKEYLDHTLHQAECPVLLLPDGFIMPRNIILAYDGSASSMFAIKQFTYLMPQLTDMETLVMYADKSDEEIPFPSPIKEYAACHFNKPGYYKLTADPGKYFQTWIENKGATLLVSGSFGRSAFSELFHKNFLRDAIKEQKVPIFIAHL